MKLTHGIDTMKTELWHFLINGIKDEQQGCYRNFYCYGQHLGDALNNAFESTKNMELHDPYLVEASQLKNSLKSPLPADVVKLSDKVYIKPEKYLYPLTDINN